MILEVAILDVIPGKDSDFQQSFAEAEKIIIFDDGVFGPRIKTWHRKSVQIYSTGELAKNSKITL